MPTLLGQAPKKVRVQKQSLGKVILLSKFSKATPFQEFFFKKHMLAGLLRLMKTISRAVRNVGLKHQQREREAPGRDSAPRDSVGTQTLRGLQQGPAPSWTPSWAPPQTGHTPSC